MHQSFLPINTILIALIAVVVLVLGANAIALLMNSALRIYIKAKGL